MYAGDNAPETLAAVILKEPSFDHLPAGTPAPVRRLLRRCLEKDPKRRLRDIGEARFALEEPETATEAPTETTPPQLAPNPRRRILPWLIAGATIQRVHQNGRH